MLAGLDPAAPAVLKLLGLLHRRIEEGGRCRLFLDDLLDVAAFYRETPLAVVLQQQCHAAAAEAAEVQVEGGEEAEQWGEGTGQDMLAQHIALHKQPAALPSPGQPAVECM